MRFEIALAIELLKIDCSSWRAVCFLNDDHGATPYDWFSHVNWLDNNSCNIIVKLFLDYCSPMNGYWDRRMSSKRYGIVLQMNMGRFFGLYKGTVFFFKALGENELMTKSFKRGIFSSMGSNGSCDGREGTCRACTGHDCGPKDWPSVTDISDWWVNGDWPRGKTPNINIGCLFRHVGHRGLASRQILS